MSTGGLPFDYPPTFLEERRIHFGKNSSSLRDLLHRTLSSPPTVTSTTVNQVDQSDNPPPLHSLDIDVESFVLPNFSSTGISTVGHTGQHFAGLYSQVILPPPQQQHPSTSVVNFHPSTRFRISNPIVPSYRQPQTANIDNSFHPSGRIIESHLDHNLPPSSSLSITSCQTERTPANTTGTMVVADSNVVQVNQATLHEGGNMQGESVVSTTQQQAVMDSIAEFSSGEPEQEVDEEIKFV